MKIKRCIAVALFVTVFAATLYVLSLVFTPKWVNAQKQETRMWNGFYDEGKNSLDVIYIGSSVMYSGVSPMEMYKDYGFTGYVCASPNQSPLISKSYVKELLKYQKPKVIVLFSHIFKSLNTDTLEGQWRRSLDNMELGTNKIETALKVVQESENQTLLSYLIPFFRYQASWDDLSTNDVTYLLSDKHNALKGWLLRDETYDGPTDASFSQRNSETNTDPDAVATLRETIELCQANGIQVLLFEPPLLSSEYNLARSDVLKSIAEDYGIDFLDCNYEDIWQGIGVNAAEDFCDEAHLNANGAFKTSSYLGKYLSEHYYLPDHREDAAYAQWDEDLDTYQQTLFDSLVAPDYAVKLSVKQVNTNVLLEWKAVNMAVCYTISRATRANGGFEVIAENVTGTQFEDAITNRDETYYYKVAAQIDFNGSPRLCTASYVIVSKTLTAPHEVTVLKTENGNLLSWKRVPEADGYKVFRSETKDGGYTGIYQNFDETLCMDAAIEAGKYYYYKIVAYKDIEGVTVYTAGSAPASLPGHSTTPEAPTSDSGPTAELPAPQNFTATETEDGILLTWAPVQGADGYKVYRSENPKTDFKGIVHSWGNTSYLTEKGAADVTYYYKVFAYVESGSTRIYSAGSAAITP